jgi:hypothetical protein
LIRELKGLGLNVELLSKGGVAANEVISSEDELIAEADALALAKETGEEVVTDKELGIEAPEVITTTDSVDAPEEE